MSYSLIPTADYKAACDAIRAKTGKTDLIKSGDMASEIASVPTGGGGASFNIHYGTEAPEDTSKLWVETDTEPTETRVMCDISGEHSIEAVGAFSTSLTNIGVGVVGTKIYLFGGYQSGCKNTIYRLDTETSEMTLLAAQLPVSLCGMAVGVVGTKVYLFGGIKSGNTGSSSSDNVNTIYEFDSETETIRTLTAVLPTVLSGMAVGVVGTKVYVLGGRKASSGYEKNTISVFDTVTETITTLGYYLPQKFFDAGVGVVGTKIYLFGGYTPSEMLSTIYEFDTETGITTTLSSTLPAQTYWRGRNTAVIGTKVYLFGGYSGGSLNTIYEFDAHTQELKTLNTTLPTNSNMFTAGAVGTIAYVFGGSNYYVFTIQADLTENTAAVVPSLTKNICSLMEPVRLGVENVYIGNAENKAERVNAYLHNGTEWALIE